MATETATEARKPNPVDVHVGSRIRMRRKLIGVSQEQLSDVLGLTFQQVQKYENGHNRVSASKLWDIARKLEVDVSYFFEGLQDAASEKAAPPTADPMLKLATAHGGFEVAQGYLAAPQAGRVAMIAMARAFTGAAPFQAA